MKPNHTNSPKTTVKIVHISHTFILMAAVLLCVSFSFFSISRRSARADQLAFIEKYSSLTDANINNNLHDYLYEALNRPITSLDALSHFFKTNNNDSEYFHEIRLVLHNHYLIKRVFQDIILFRASDNAFVSAARAGYNINDASTQSSLDYADLHELLTLPHQETPILYCTENARTYYLYPIYFHGSQSAEHDSYAGFCAIWLDAEAFFNLDAIDLQSNGTTLIINNDNILYANGRNILSNEAILNIIDKFSERPDNYLYETLFSTDYSFFYTKSESNGLIYLYYEPVPDFITIFSDFSEPATIMYLICIAVIVFFFFIILIIKIKNTRLSKISTAKKEITINSEGHIFKNSFDLLHGNANPSALDEMLCNIISTSTPYKYTSCILIEPEPLTILKMSAEQKADFIREIIVSLDMHLDNTPDTYYSILHYPNNLLTCIINSSSFIPENIAHNILEHLNAIYDCQFNVFCTTPTISLSELPRSYAAILDSRKYAHVYGYNNVFTQDTIELYEAADAIIDTGLIEKIQELINQEYFEELIQYLRNLPSVVRQRGFSCFRIRDHYRIIFNVINDNCKKNQPDYPYRDMPLSDIINQFESIDECSAFLCDQVALLASSIAENRKVAENNPNKKYIDHIIEYINENIATISLTQTAENFNISTAHLSRIFKELTGTNFSDYVADKKLQQAAWLLINDRTLSVSDIAKNLGYNTPAYFSRKFKEYFEVTPAAYRKQHLGDN